MLRMAMPQFIPSPPVNGVHIGPLYVHFYGLMYVVAIAAAIVITRRRYQAAGGNPALVSDLAIWVVPAGIVGARIYFDITTPFDIRPAHEWWGPLAVWNGGLGVWGGIAAGAAVGIWRTRRAGADWRVMCDAVAPALLVAQAIGRIGNYFNQELFGNPSGLPWALEITRAARVSAAIPAADLKYRTFQPSFLYELIFDLALAAVLVWLGHHRAIRPPGLLALYVAGYSAYRIFEETIRIDSSAHFLGLRLNFFIAIVVTLAGLAWFVISQRSSRPAGVGPAGAGPGAAAETTGAAQTTGAPGTTGAAQTTGATEPGGARPGTHKGGALSGPPGEPSGAV